jgi:hypothetical protein
MKIKEKQGLDFEIYKLTNSIENVITGDSFSTDISILAANELKNITKKQGWLLIGKRSIKNLPGTFIN